MEKSQLVENLFKIKPVSTDICICHNTNKFTTLQSGELWPIPVRGSKYKIRFSEHSVVHESPAKEPVVRKDPKGDQRRIGMERLKEFSPGPVVERDTIHLIEGIRKYGNGSVIITPKGEAIVWRKDGHEWNPYYVGQVNIDPIWSQYPARLGHPGVNGLFPDVNSLKKDWFTPEEWGLWSGCMFKTGEPWTIRQKARQTSELTWPGRLSAMLSKGLIILGTEPIHAELIEAYLKVRPCGGRMYVLMGGHIWINARKQDIADDDVWNNLKKKMAKTMRELIKYPNHPLLQMYNTRMMATKGDGPITEGCMPIYLGNCANFDEGKIPVTKIASNYKRTARDPNKIEGDEENPYANRNEMNE
jgi:hypothetical protein